MRQLSYEESLKVIGLIKKNKNTFSLENMIIKPIDKDSLNILRIKNKQLTTENITISGPMRYFKDGKEYHLINQNQKLLVFEI